MRNTSPAAAPSTRARIRPLRLLGTRAFPDRSSASKAEHAIRQLPREKKLAFLASST